MGAEVLVTPEVAAQIATLERKCRLLGSAICNPLFYALIGPLSLTVKWEGDSRRYCEVAIGSHNPGPDDGFMGMAVGRDPGHAYLKALWYMLDNLQMVGHRRGFRTFDLRWALEPEPRPEEA